MKTFLKIYYRETLFVLTIIVLLVFFGSTRCSVRKSETSNLQTNDVRKEVIDSMKEESNKELLRLKDSLLDLNSIQRVKDKAKTKQAQNEARTATERADISEARYERNKTIQNCDSALKDKNILISKKDTVIKKLNTELTNCDTRGIIIQSKFDISESLVIDKQNSIERLNKDILLLQKSNKRTWVERNSIWIGVIAGGIGTGLIIR